MASPRRSSNRKRIAACMLAAAVSAGCATSLPPTAYLPARDGGVQTVRRGGSAYAALNAPTGGVLLSLQPVDGADPALLRLWLHVQNRRDRVFVLDPERDIYLERRVAGSASRKRIAPEPPEEAARVVTKAASAQGHGRALRKTRVMPGESVRGAVYFRGDGIAPKQASYGYEIVVHVRTPGGMKRVLLRPIPSPS
jgi:hypothetical protein